MSKITGNVSEENEDFLESEHKPGNEDISEDERLKIRERISHMSFEDLQELKNKMGTKLYNKTLFGIDNRKSKVSFKRANKNRPREESSKRKVVNRQAKNNIAVPIISVKKHIPRDPRFDPMCGTFDNQSFKDNYKFVTNLRKQEKTQLEKELKQVKDPEQKTKLKFLVQRLDNQIREEEKNEQRHVKQIAQKKEFKQKIKMGEKPEFKKKSVKRLEDLISKYEELKKSNKLQKHIEKRSKKLKTKDRKKFHKEKLLP